MVKRSRDEASAPQARRQAKYENPTKPTPPKHPSLAGATTGKARGSMDGRRPQPEATMVPGGSLSPQVVAGKAPELAHAEWDVGSAAAVLPRWWQLWLGRGGGMVVDYEELLWGWFPFVDEDFSTDVERVEWFSIWGE